MGHDVLVVAPGDSAMAPIYLDKEGVVRMPAIASVAGSGFAFPLPTAEKLTAIIAAFNPDIIHSHHQFSLGKAALIAARLLQKPIVVTVHTFLENMVTSFKTPIKTSPSTKIAAAAASFLGMATFPIFYENQCDAVLAPTDSAARLLLERGVTSPIYITPSGIDADMYARPDGAPVRKKYALDPGAFVIGHVGRLSKEKNLILLANAIAIALADNFGTRAVIVGDGPCMGEMKAIFQRRRVGARVRWLGVKRGQDLANAYGAMDVFGFASVIETQGLVLAESMAASTPVIALDGPGTRDIIRSGENGQIVSELSPEALAEAMIDWAKIPRPERARRRAQARATGFEYALEKTTARLVSVYMRVAHDVRQRVQSR